MLEITQARPDEYQAAFALAYQRLPPEHRRLQVAQALQMVHDGTLDPAGLWIARDRRTIRGVQIAVPLGGAAFLFWLPETRGSRDGADALVQAALRWCVAEGGKLAQAIIPPADAPRADLLVRHGFRVITRLRYLEHDLRTLSAAPRSTVSVQIAAWTPAIDATFRAVLVQSYAETLDCPELNGLRSVDDILTGYRAASIGGAAPWWLIRADDMPAGIVILTDLPEGRAWDLSYLGVQPSWRRHGIGGVATWHAVNAARTAGATRLLLAVDERNAPARRLYDALGFVETEARDVYLCLLDG